jgi:hypothetical protein
MMLSNAAAKPQTPALVWQNIGRPRRRARRIMHNNVQEILTLNYDYKAAAFGDSAFVPAWRRASWRKKYRAA